MNRVPNAVNVCLIVFFTVFLFVDASTLSWHAAHQMPHDNDVRYIVSDLVIISLNIVFYRWKS